MINYFRNESSKEQINNKYENILSDDEINNILFADVSLPDNEDILYNLHQVLNNGYDENSTYV